MPKLSDFDFDQLNFETDSIQVLSISHSDKDFVFPLTRAPINFSVWRSDGVFSHRWGVNTNNKGDAYIYRRDNPNAEKVSLHASGRQHISMSSETAKHVSGQSRFGPVWSEPEFEQDAIASFSLLFPAVGGGKSPEPSESTKDELIIVGHREKMVVVSFFIVDSTKNMRGRIPHFALGQLPSQTGKTLHVITWKEDQNNFLDRIRDVFPEISMQVSELNTGEGDIDLCLMGYRGSNSAFLVNVPVHYRPPSETG
ncbi:MAG: hypothetical protein OXS28_00875 [Gammaproteobacteria bacterium]|nr:hypothetical protein [Gammaproteobacteria bacterium]